VEVHDSSRFAEIDLEIESTRKSQFLNIVILGFVVGMLAFNLLSPAVDRLFVGAWVVLTFGFVAILAQTHYRYLHPLSKRQDHTK
jgi:hypothetical protein